MRKLLILSMLASLGASGTAFALDPSYLKLTVYGVAVSTNADCSNPTKIFHSSSGVEMDFIANPTLGSGNLSDGTYPCVMITMSDLIKFSPKTSDGVNCVAGTAYTADVCRADNGCKTQTFNGTTIPAVPGSGNGHGTDAAPVHDLVTMYLSTASNNSGEVFLQPSGSTNGLTLGSAFVVSGTKTGTFVVNAIGKVVSGGGQCGMDPPTFSFR